MDKFVAKANIEHFRRKLAQETDEAKRQVLARLLAEEEAKLASRDPDHKSGTFLEGACPLIGGARTSSDRTPLARMLPRVIGWPDGDRGRLHMPVKIPMAAFGESWRDSGHGFSSLFDPQQTSAR
jgi:hypothetical protein